MFTSRAFATGIPTVLTSGTVSAYEDNSITQITAGITLGVDHDSVVGLNLVTIAATAANGFETGKDYNLVLTVGTVDGVSVVGETVGHFSLGRSAAAVDVAANKGSWLTATGFATTAALTAHDNDLTTLTGNIATLQVTATALDSAMETDGVGGYQFTTLGLENAPSGGGGGDATLANQTTILALMAGGVTTQSPLPSATTMELVAYDSYDGTALPLLTWTVTKDYTTATSVKLVIYANGDPTTIYKTAAAVVASATSITVDLDVDFVSELTFAGCPLTSTTGFALVALFGTSAETIARGTAYVYDRGVPV